MEFTIPCIVFRVTAICLRWPTGKGKPSAGYSVEDVYQTLASNPMRVNLMTTFIFILLLFGLVTCFV